MKTRDALLKSTQQDHMGVTTKLFQKLEISDPTPHIAKIWNGPHLINAIDKTQNYQNF